MEKASPSLTLYTGKLPGIDRLGLETKLGQLQSVLFDELGLIVPPVRLQLDESLRDDEFQLQISDQRLAIMQSIQSDEFLLNIPAGQLDATSWWGRIWNARPAADSNTGSRAAIVQGDEAARHLWEDKGYETGGPLTYVVFATESAVSMRAAELLTQELVEYYLARLRARFPVLVEVVRQRFDIANLTGALRAKLKAGTSIRDLRATLENLLSESGEQ